MQVRVRLRVGAEALWEARMIEVRSHPFPGVTIIDRLPAGHRRPLQQGDHFRYPEDCGEGDQVFEVVAVSHACAMVRSLSKNHVERVMYDKKLGADKLVTFDQPRRVAPISRYASVEVLQHGG